MQSKVGTTSRVSAAVLMIVNLIVMVLCVVLFAFGLWMISSPTSLSAVIQGFGSSAMKALLSPPHLTVQLGIATSILATFLFFVAFMGFHGAISRSPFLLFMYSVLVLLLLLLECALLFYFSSSLVEKGLREQDGQWTHALRITFKCCEHNSSTLAQDKRPPWSCCGSESYPDNCTLLRIYEKNCHEAIASWLHRYSTAIYTSLSSLHIVLSTCSILRRSRSASRFHS